MKYIVAVSGGVDSVVLLDMLVQGSLQDLALQKGDELIVAHFDHGIRPDSAADERFVQALAQTYNLTYEGRREELGKHASEAQARERRYAFLRDLADRHKAQIMTAHHQDDLIETIAINIERGTGWRGLAVFTAPDIHRPLLGKTKAELYNYACAHGLEWVEDETNSTDAYLRNRLRRKLHTGLKTSTRKKVIDYWKHQSQLRTNIEAEDKKVLGDATRLSRHFFIHIDEMVAGELLRTALAFAITRPQTTRLLHAIKTAKSGTTMEIGADHIVRFTLRDFIVETP